MRGGDRGAAGRGDLHPLTPFKPGETRDTYGGPICGKGLRVEH